MYKFLFVYICTGVYKNMFDGFVKSLPNLGYNDDVTYDVRVLTDDINFDVKQYETDKIKIHEYYITHLPWPLITLLKMHYINNFVNEDVDAIFYCNCNFRFYRIEHIDAGILRNGKMKLCNVPCQGWAQENYYDSSLIYCHGCMFYGDPKAMKYFCDFVIHDTNERLLNDNEILIKHDESEINMFTKHIKDCNLNAAEIYEIYSLFEFGYLDYNVHRNGDFIKNHTERSYAKPISLLDFDDIKR